MTRRCSRRGHGVFHAIRGKVWARSRGVLAAEAAGHAAERRTVKRPGMQQRSDTQPATAGSTALRGWVLYDGSCGFCRRWVPYWEETLRKRGFAIAPLQAPWVAAQLRLPAEELLQDLRLLLPDGNRVAGADVYRYLMRRIWWAYPLYLLSISPLLRVVFDWSYRNFALHRHAISRTCGLPGAEEIAGD